MNRFNKILSLASIFLITACTPSKEVAHNYYLEHSIDETYENLYNEEDIVSKGMMGGWFTDINTCRFLATDSEYLFTYTSPNKVDPSFTVSSSHKSHATVRLDEKDKSKFYLETKSPGDTILTIKDANDMLVYRNTVRVRPAYPQKELLKEAYKADYFQSVQMYEGWLGSWKFSLMDDSNTPMVTLKGGDDFDRNVETTFKLTYSDYDVYGDRYIYLATDVETNSRDTLVTAICFTRTCDLAYVYYLSSGEEHLLSILYNSNISYVYE